MTPSFALLYPRLQFAPSDCIRPDGSLALPYLAGALRRAGYEVSILDCCVGTSSDDLNETFYNTAVRLPSGLVRVGMSDERILAEVEPFDVVGITSIFTMQTTPVLELARLIRRNCPEKTIVAGGVNARELRDRFFAAGVDAVFVSEADQAIVQFARALEAGADWRQLPGVASYGRPVKPAGSAIHDLDELAMPAWDLLPNERYWTIARPHGGEFPPGSYVKYASMMTSRGCPFVCSYCHISKEAEGDVAGAIGALRLKSVGRVLAEARTLQALGVEYVFVEDDSLLAKKRRVLEIFAGLRGMGLTLVDVNGVNVAHLTRKDGGRLVVDRELLQSMALAGFKRISLPFEAGTQRVIDRWASRKWRLQETDTLDLIKACRDAGITPIGNYTIGYPDESFDEMMATIMLARRHMDAGLDYASFFIIVPFPGTQLFDHAVATGQLGADFNPDEMNWTRSVFRHAPVKPDVLEAIRTVSWRLLNKPRSVEIKTSLSPGGLRAA